MSPPRVRCAAAPIFRDRHQAVGSWYVLTTPDGAVYEFCSGCCLLEYACPVSQPADAAGATVHTSTRAGASGEAA